MQLNSPKSSPTGERGNGKRGIFRQGKTRWRVESVADIGTILPLIRINNHHSSPWMRDFHPKRRSLHPVVPHTLVSKQDKSRTQVTSPFIIDEWGFFMYQHSVLVQRGRNNYPALNQWKLYTVSIFNARILHFSFCVAALGCQHSALAPRSLCKMFASYLYQLRLILTEQFFKCHRKSCLHSLLFWLVIAVLILMR